MPKQPNWFIDFSGDLKKSGNHGIYEIPIASIPKSVFEIPTKFKVKKYAHRAPENRGFLIHDRKPIGFFHKFKQMFSSRMLTFDNYTYSHEYLMKVLNFNIKKHRSFKNQIFSVIGHPKSMGDYSFELMERFIDNVRKTYPEARFTTFSQIEKEKLND
jgi:ADP-glucose pyrophosphorylase